MRTSRPRCEHRGPSAGFHFGCLRVKRQLDQPSYQRIAHDRTIRVPNTEPHAPDELELRFDNAALELLLQREELGIEADGAAATLFFLGPGTPSRGEVDLEPGPDQTGLLVVGKRDCRLGVDGRLALLRRLP